MKKLTVIYRTERNGSMNHKTTTNYKTKKALTTDCRGNGLRVIKILDEKEIENIKAKNYIYDTEQWQEYVRQVL